MFICHGCEIEVHELTGYFVIDSDDVGEAALKVHLLDLIDDDEGIDFESRDRGQ